MKKKLIIASLAVAFVLPFASFGDEIENDNPNRGFSGGHRQTCTQELKDLGVQCGGNAVAQTQEETIMLQIIEVLKQLLVLYQNK